MLDTLRFKAVNVLLIISSPLQALMANAMSEVARKSVIAMVVETLSCWMWQLGAVWDHWRAGRNYRLRIGF